MASASLPCSLHLTRCFIFISSSSSSYAPVFTLSQEQEGVIASDSVEDVLLDDCHARAVRFNCPNMTNLSMRLTKLASFTFQNCSSLRSLDLQCELTTIASTLWLSVHAK